VGKFSSQVAGWSDKARRRALATFRQAAQETMHEANLPVGQGGRMRVDTGFLKGSIQASLDGMPTGPTEGTKGMTYSGQVAGAPPELVILKAQLGDRIWVGWTAGYARVREYYDGFVRSAAANWPTTVKRVAARVKAALP
jgi:hypothetical protein